VKPSSQGQLDEIEQSGAIAWMARNPVAANLLMFCVVGAGALALGTIDREVYPDYSLDQVAIDIRYPGASPHQVEEGVVLPVEEALGSLQGIGRVTARAARHGAAIGVELERGQDTRKLRDEIDDALQAIETFPDEVEEIRVRIPRPRLETISVVLSAPDDTEQLRRQADRVRRELRRLPGVGHVALQGLPPAEITIELSSESLQAHHLTLNEVARQVAAASADVPGGALETDEGALLVELDHSRQGVEEFADLSLIPAEGPAESSLRLGDIADVRHGDVDPRRGSFLDGQRAVRLVVYRGDQTPEPVVGQAVRQAVEDLKEELPSGYSVMIWRDFSEMLEGRLELLATNARLGLVLVVLILALFLRARLAFWIACGVPIAFFGAFALMPGLGLTINLVSLFGFILTLGLVVDDAIIVGEQVYRLREAGLPWLTAAIVGTRQVARPVVFAALTSIVAFAPIYILPGMVGKIFYAIPLLASVVLVLSLAEALFVLPAHLGHARQWPPRLVDGVHRWFRWLTLLPTAAEGMLRLFIGRVYQPLLRRALEYRYATIALALTSLLVSGGLVQSGLVPFNFDPRIESDAVVAVMRLSRGASLDRCDETRRLLEQTARRVVEDAGAEHQVQGIFSRLGGLPGGRRRAGREVVAVELNLVPAHHRSVSPAQLASAWADALPEVPGAVSTTIDSDFGGPSLGAPVALDLVHHDSTVLAAASQDLARRLKAMVQLTNVQNDWEAESARLRIHLLPRAQQLGLTGAAVGHQLHAAFQGTEALRLQRGSEELRVVVRLPAGQRQSEQDVKELPIRLPQGGYVPLRQVATWERDAAPAVLYREDGQSTVTVRAFLRPEFKDLNPVLTALTTTHLPALREQYAGLDLSFAGQQRSQTEFFDALWRTYPVALLVIFAILAIPLRSYLQPLLIMTVIPFGFVGAVAGHLVMGQSLNVVSLLGVVALTGVVVNDSLILIDALNRERAAGRPLTDALIQAGRQRCRPILLTSVTTFLGLAPMMVETSVQAQFLVPMTVSLGFGLLFATAIVLLLIPALVMVVDDARRGLGWALGHDEGEAPPHS
jgi:multidrug efflux pump subunit AcrB